MAERVKDRPAQRDRATDDAQDLFTRGHKALDAGDFREAVECFSRAITLRPNVSGSPSLSMES